MGCDWINQVQMVVGRWRMGGKLQVLLGPYKYRVECAEGFH